MKFEIWNLNFFVSFTLQAHEFNRDSVTQLLKAQSSTESVMLTIADKRLEEIISSQIRTLKKNKKIKKLYKKYIHKSHHYSLHVTDNSFKNIATKFSSFFFSFFSFSSKHAMLNHKIYGILIVF